MKKILILFVITILMACASNSKQSIKDSYTHKIVKSYNHLINNNLIEVNVVVSDTIIRLRTDMFSRFLYSKKSNLIENKFADSLFREDLSMNHKDYFYPVKETLNNHTEEAKEIMYFSQARGNYLTVEVFDFKEKHARQPYFLGQSTLYLFVFKNGKIDKVYSEIIFYG